jgi:putative intracellular protease/amidase
LAVAALPFALSAAGLNPAYAGPKHALPGGRALIVTTSRDTLGDTGRKTGVYASEMTVPYYAFLDGGMAVDVASVRGGKIPIEPVSLRWPFRAPEDVRFLADAEFRRKADDSLKIDSVDFTKYDIVFMAGGWGAAYDLGYSRVLGDKLTEAFAADAALGSVCHGALGFLNARDKTGAPLVKGRRMTAVTDKQVRELRISITPQHPERELRAAGALYESSTAFLDIFASRVVADGNIVTGQNQNDGAAAAQLLMERAAKRGKN